MSHTVHPYSHRLGIIRDWKSRWFGVKGKYKEFLKSDVLLREYLEKKFRGFFISNIEMERSQKALRIIIETSRPGILIGRNGEGAVKLKNDIIAMLKKKGLSSDSEEIKLDIKEVRYPESNASIVAQMVSEGLEKRMSFRRVVKQAVEKVMANKGRLGGADMSRKEKLKKGRVPLQTFRADVDFARYEARLAYGKIGIQVWIYKGDIFNEKPKV